MKNWILGILLLLPLSVLADDVILDWIGPTERENNKPYVVDERGGFRVQDSYDNSILDIPDGNASSHKFTDVPVGIHNYKIQAYDTEGRPSVWSSEVIVEIFEEVILPPKSPTLTVTVQKASY